MTSRQHRRAWNRHWCATECRPHNNREIIPCMLLIGVHYSFVMSEDATSKSRSNNNSSFSSSSASGNPKPVRDDESESSRLCNKWVTSGLRENKAIQLLVQTLEDLGCTTPNGFVSCRQCENPQASGFGKVLKNKPQSSSSSSLSLSSTSLDCEATIVRDFQSALDLQNQTQSVVQLKPEIFVCQQYMENELMTHKTMVHELIHAIDLCRTKMDPINNCLHLACTEIRAENLSGECSFFKEFIRMKAFKGHGGECIKRRALLSVRANPKCAPRAEEYIEATMPRCLLDNYPFVRHPNQMRSIGERK